MPRDNSYPSALAKTDPLVMEPVKIPTSTLETLTVVALQQRRYRTYVIRQILVEAAEKFQKELGEEYAKLVREVRKRAPARTAAAKLVKAGTAKGGR